MKLIKCHIENFGKLKNVDYSFNSGLTEFCEQNGFGKTTLAAFIKAMFYGLPSVRVNTKEFNDRKHFYPFSGGKFGGNIIFEFNGAIYRIERYFGKKSDTEDELSVYCNNKIFNGFSADIGRAIFGVDKESFERTVFITSDSVDSNTTSGICAKLNCFVENADGETAFDNVIAKIERAKKNLKAAKGSNDLISQTNQAIFDKKSEIANLEIIAKSLDESYTKKNVLEQKIIAEEAEIDKVKNANLVIERWEKYDALAANGKRIQSELNERQNKYPYGLPDNDEIQSLKNCVKQKTMLDGAQTVATFDAEKQKRLQELSDAFHGGVPDEQTLKSLRYDLDEIKGIAVKTAGLTENDGGRRQADLQQKFARGVPSQTQIDSLENEVEKYRTLENRRKAQTTLSAPVNTSKKNNVLCIMLLIAFAVVAITGIALIFVNTIAGSALLAVGVVSAVIDAIIWILKGNAATHSTVIIDRSAIEMQAQLQQTEGDIREVLVKYGYYSQNGVAFDFEMLKKDLADLKQYGEDAAVKQLKIAELEARRDRLVSKAESIFVKYNIECGDLQNAYDILYNRINEYKNLKSDAVRAERGADDTKKQLEGIYAAINAIFDKYKIQISDNVYEQITELERAGADILRLQGELEVAIYEMKDYASKYNLTERPANEIVDVSQLSEQVKEGRNQLAILDGQISTDEAMIENLNDRYSELEVLEEKLNDYKRRHYVLSETEKMIKKADQNLKDRYVAPVKDIFIKYADMIEKTLGEKINIDMDFNIMFEHSGEIYSEKHFSSGLRSICALCMRLAFVQNMYGEEKPFIIMDDPFVFLDGVHMENTSRVIKELAKDNQIIYFCCHDSRKMEALSE